MSAMSRRKGASYEREIVNLIKAAGHACARNLDQVRDGGGDIPFGEWLIECKRRASIGLYQWWDQVCAACRDKKPLLIIRANKRENLVVMRLPDFLELVSRSQVSMETRPPFPPS